MGEGHGERKLHTALSQEAEKTRARAQRGESLKGGGQGPDTVAKSHSYDPLPCTRCH